MNNFSKLQLDIMLDYVKEMIDLLREEGDCYNTTYNIKFDLKTFLELKITIESNKDSIKNHN